MKAELFKEHEDGSITFAIDLTPEEATAFICLGLVTAIREGMDQGKQYVGDLNE